MKRVFSDLRLFGAAALVATGIAYGLGIEKGNGMLLGLASTIVNFLGLWAVIWILKQDSLKNQKLRAWGAVLLFFGSLPLSIWCMMIVHGIGKGAPGAFLSGLAMVYLWAIGWAESTKPN